MTINGFAIRQKNSEVNENGNFNELSGEVVHSIRKISKNAGTVNNCAQKVLTHEKNAVYLSSLFETACFKSPESATP